MEQKETIAFSEDIYSMYLSLVCAHFINNKAYVHAVVTSITVMGPDLRYH